MADLINSTYFEKGDLYIPNNDDLNASSGLTVISDLDFLY